MLQSAKRPANRPPETWKRLELFSIHEEAGNGLIFWDPKGTRIRHQIESLLKDLQYRVGYDFVTTPPIWRASTCGKSAVTLIFYRENLFAPMLTDDVEYIIKPMICPGHILIYKNQNHSYRDLPSASPSSERFTVMSAAASFTAPCACAGSPRTTPHFLHPGSDQGRGHGRSRPYYLLMDIFGFEVKVFLSTRPKICGNR